MTFQKLQALGNDFVVFGNPSQTSLPKPDFIRHICNRHYGIGADCAVFVSHSDKADFAMHVYNPDGFEAEICGNALRCTTKYVHDNGFFKRRNFDCETLSGIRRLTIENDNITVQIGVPNIIGKGTLSIANANISYTAISVGNPHCVVFTSSLTDEEFHLFGRAIERHPIFPEGTNVEFATIFDENQIAIRIWERGIGETLSCSTGSCACAFAAFSEGLTGTTTHVHQAGGIITTKLHDDGNMYISGSCITVFKGTLLYQQNTGEKQ